MSQSFKVCMFVALYQILLPVGLSCFLLAFAVSSLTMNSSCAGSLTGRS